MAGQYAVLYRHAREALEIEAENRLGRALTPHERNLFRNCGTLTMLEEVGMIVFYAQNAEELSTKLAAMSMDGRFKLALEELTQRLQQYLARPLTHGEQQQLQALGNIEELWLLEERLKDAPQPARESLLRTLLLSA